MTVSMTYANLFRIHSSSKRGSDDGEQIDSDVPSSGVATPMPDPADKRLPGIMPSYFGQVGSGSSTSQNSDWPLQTPALNSTSKSPSPVHHREQTVDQGASSAMSAPHQESESSHDDEGGPPPLLPHERLETSQPASSQASTDALHPYPTPPVSCATSLHKLKLRDSVSDGEEKGSSDEPASPQNPPKPSESLPVRTARKLSIMNPLSSIVTTSHAHASFSKLEGSSTSDSSPSKSRFDSGFAADSPSYDRLKKLTDDAESPREKSNPPTPTRALSSNRTSASENSTDAQDAQSRASDNTSEPRSSTSEGDVPVKSPKGKLRVKILEARGLRKSQDPYVVAVFQRNELVSKGPRPENVDEEHDDETSPVGGIPISRTGSDNGRSMAIPMRSRQSSSTSLNEYRDSKGKGKSKNTITDPKWDAEALL